MNFHCPHCNESFRDQKGLTMDSKVLCPTCNTKFFIKDVVSVESPSTPVNAEKATPNHSPNHTPKQPNKASKNTGIFKGIFPTFIIAIFLLIGGYVLYQKYSLSHSANETTSNQASRPLRPIPNAVTMPSISAKNLAPKPLSQAGGNTHLNAIFQVGKTQPVSDASGRPWWGLSGYWKLNHPFNLSKTQVFLACRPEAEPNHYHGLFAVGPRNYDNFSVMQFHGKTLHFSGEDNKGYRFGTNVKEHASVRPNQPMLLTFTPKNGKCQVRVNNASPVTIPANLSTRYFGAAYANRPYFKGKIAEIRTYQPLSPPMTAYVQDTLAEFWGINRQGTGYIKGFRNAPGAINNEVRQISSKELTLAFSPSDTSGASDSSAKNKNEANDKVNDKTVPNFSLYLGRGRSANLLTLDALPKTGDITSRCDTSWYLGARAPLPKNAPKNLYFSFDNNLTQTLSKSLGKHGFYALLFRKSQNDDFHEIASASSTSSGAVNFGPLVPRVGFYSLGIIQGVITKVPKLEIMVNGKPATAKTTFHAGERIHLTCKGKESFHITLKERDSGVIWYRGSSDNMHLSSWLVRGGTTKLTAIVASKLGYISRKIHFDLTVNNTRFALYPGLTAQILNLNVNKSIGAHGAFPTPADMKPHHQSVGTSQPMEPVFAKYPAYRTSESVLKAHHAPGKAGFSRPDYWQMICANPSFSRNRARFFPWQLTTDYPFGDIYNGGRVAIYLKGLIMVEHSGTYTFKVEGNVPLKMNIAGQETTLKIDTQKDAKAKWPLRSTTVTIKLQPGLTPYSMMVNRQCNSPTDVHVLWKKPGEEKFTTLTGDHFLHQVSPDVERAYKKFTKNFQWRHIRPVTPSKKSTAGGKMLHQIDFPATAATWKSFKATCDKLMNTWQNDAELAGSPEVANAILQLIIARADVQRKDKPVGRYRPQILLGKWAVCNGNYLVYYESLRGFLEACIRNPELQSAALKARNAINAYTTRVYARSFFNEGHNGTNDGYNDFHNFIVNSWRSARVIDDPTAFDAARSLYDNHFRYGAERMPGLHSDNIFDFHSANGRHISQGGYGDNWMSRIFNGIHWGTPWGNTREQYRRLAEFAMAYEWFFYKGARSYSFAGRARTGIGWFGLGTINRFYNLPHAILDEATWRKLDAVKDRRKKKEPLVGNHFFGRHLLHIHRNKDFFLEVKMAAPGVGGVETFAGAYPGNLSFGDGVTTILKRGDEYKAINAVNIPEALWKFRALPGTTQLNYEWARLDRYRGWSGTRAGGVSDGEFGHCAFEFTSHKRNATKADKMFTFLEDGMVVMGTGITGSRKASQPYYSYRSNINQCVRSGDVKITTAQGKTLTIPAKEITKTITLPMNQSYWITHRGIGYLVVPTHTEMGATSHAVGKLVIESEVRTPLNRLQPDIWKDKNMAGYKKQCETLVKRKKPRQANVLTMWIDHGAQPKDASCVYMVCMRPDKAPVSQWLKKPPFTILSNDKNLQALRDDRKQILHAFFYHPEKASVKDEKGKTILSVKEPASVMVRPLANGKTSYTVQDPFAAIFWQKNKKADVIHLTESINGTAKKIDIQLPGAYDPDDRYKAAPITVIKE